MFNLLYRKYKINLIIFFLFVQSVFSYYVNKQNEEISVSRDKRAFSKNVKYNWTTTIQYKTQPGINFFIVSKTYYDRPQKIFLSKECQSIVPILHETFHALGAIHEFGRPDKDNHLTVNKDNIESKALKNFELNEASKILTYDLKFDHGSVMNYDRYAFSHNNKPTIDTKDSHYSQTMGQFTEIGFNDIKQLNLHYCSHKCRKIMPLCKTNGYPDPNRCEVCKCPRLYGGNLCEKLANSDKKCGETKHRANDKLESFYLKGEKKCYIQINVPIGFNVNITVSGYFKHNDFVCHSNQGVEVKYHDDKSVSGAIFCGKFRNKSIISEGTTIVIGYFGRNISDEIMVSYQKILMNKLS